MKGLAEFVMRGRLQALVVVVVGASSVVLSWISAAVVALVTLRKGAGQGAWLLFWALLPAGSLLYVVGDSGPVATLLGTTALALILRATVSLPVAVLSSVVVGLVTAAAMLMFGGEMLDRLVAALAELMANLQQQLAAGGASGEALVLYEPNAQQVAGMLGLSNATGCVLCLLLARWWQSLLYNPGGFGSDFKALGLTPVATLALILPAALVFSYGVAYSSWALIFVLPLTFVGLAIVHARASLRGSGTGWLVGFYLLWLVFDPVKLIVVFVAIADSWLNFRQRWARRPASKDDNENLD